VLRNCKIGGDLILTIVGVVLIVIASVLGYSIQYDNDDYVG
jgi:hypothetical protein